VAAQDRTNSMIPQNARPLGQDRPEDLISKCPILLKLILSERRHRGKNPEAATKNREAEEGGEQAEELNATAVRDRGAGA